MSDTVESYKISLDNQLERLETVLKEKPDDPSTLMAFGEMSLRRGRKLVALLAFQKVADLKPDVLEVHLALVKIYGSQKMYAEAYAELVQALRLEKGSVEARVLYDILTRESPPPDDLEEELKSYCSNAYRAEEVNLYLQQLNIEKERLSTDVRELSLLLESSPMDTILEYNKNMAARRLSVIEELLEKTRNLEAVEAGTAKGMPEQLPEAQPEVQHPEAEPAFPEPAGEPVEAGSAPAEEAEILLPVPSQGEAAPESVQARPVEAGLSEDAARILRSLREILEPVMQGFKNTKGIVAVACFHLRNGLVHAIQDDTIDLAEMVRILSEGLEAFLGYSQDVSFWVVEFQQGVMVLQTVAPNLYFCAVGDSSTSFGSLRFHMDKNRSLFLDALKQIDLSPLS